ncbi:MAG: hypothetical protein KatS3mg006_1648 [Pyrinomonadaceae bacterium]|jgi:serine/threonine protein kinase|nr:MAG: hypothetical protein KatS3mg006_1648 [Pyrinomonadaceae bacterium]
MSTLERNTIVRERYLIVNLQSKTNDGEIYLAVDQASGKSVLIKRIFCFDERQSQELQREALVLMNLEHPSLPKFIDYFSEGSARYLVSEYISGDTLSDVVEKSNKSLPLEWVVFWADQLLEALAYLHSRFPPIVHRDIRPENLKLSKNQDVFLLGFPLSVTGQGVKSNYASLEQIRGTGVTERCDIYSLSATLYYLLTAQTPLDAKARADQVLNQLSDPIKPLNLINPNIPKEISDFVIKGMNLSPELRYSSAREMQKVLRETYEGLKNKKARSETFVPQSEVKTEILTQEDIVFEDKPLETGFETVHIVSSELEADRQESPTIQQDNTFVPPQPRFEESGIVQRDSYAYEDSSQKTLVLEEPLKEETRSPLVDEESLQSQKKTEILPEEIFPEVISAKEEAGFPHKTPDTHSFPPVFDSDSRGASSSEDVSNLTVPLVKYEELLPDKQEVVEKQEVGAIYERTTNLVQAAPQPAPPAPPVPPQRVAPSKSKKPLVAVVVILGFIFGVALIAAGAYVFRDALFSTAKPTPTPTPFVRTTPEPTPTTTPQVLIEETPEVIVQTSPTPDTIDTTEQTTEITDLKANSNVSPSKERTSTEPSRRKVAEQEKATTPTTRQTPRKSKTEAAQEPKRTPERRLEILQ